MNNSLLDRIKFLSQQKNLSLAEIERKADLAKTSIYSWKTKIPNGKALEKIADILDTNVDYLLGRSTNPNPINKEDDPSLFFRIDMQNVPEEDREEFIEQLDLLKDYALQRIKEEKKKRKLD